MKLAVYTVLIVAIGAFVYFYELPSVCDTPLAYKIGYIDQGFNMPQNELVDSLKHAEDLWEDGAGRDLLVYRPADEKALTVNMVYDSRQRTTQVLNENKDEVNTKKETLDPRINEYESRSAAFKDRAARFGAAVTSYNNQGGAPEGEYEKLLAEQESLNAEAQALNQMAQSLNRDAADYNESVSEFNDSVEEFNTVAKTQPEEGLYDPNRNTIDIYYHITNDELVHTITHEFGHALGLGHLGDTDAIMYEQVNTTMEPTGADLSALAQVCAPKTVYTKLRTTEWDRFGRFYAQMISSALFHTQPDK